MAVFRNAVAHLGHSTGSGDVMDGIDGVRAIAVTLVVLFHIYAFGSGSPEVFLARLDLRPWLATGFVGVDLFFVLSGFLLMLPWTKSYYHGSTVPRTCEFYRRRILRIVPAYYAHLAVLFSVMVPAAYSASLIISPLGFATVLAHLSFTQYLFPQTSATFGVNGALWTLTIEASFYLVLPFVARFFLGSRAFVGIVFALLIAQVWIYLSFHQLFDFIDWVLANANTFKYDSFAIQRFLALQFPAQVLFFAMGMAMTNLLFYRPGWTKNSHLSRMAINVLTVVMLASLLCVMWLMARIDLWHTLWLYSWHVIAATVLGFLVLCAAISTAVSRRVLGFPPVRLIGLISYSIYLWHLPVIFFMKKFSFTAELRGIDILHFMLLSCVPLTLAIGYLSYRYIELPFLKGRATVPSVRQ